MLQEVEQMLDYWDNLGILKNNPNRLKIASLIETQRRTNEWVYKSNVRKNPKFKLDQDFVKTVMCAIMYIGAKNPDKLEVSLDVATTFDIGLCHNVYCIGPWPRGSKEEQAKKIAMRVTAFQAPINFGGICLKNGRLYLLSTNELS